MLVRLKYTAGALLGVLFAVAMAPTPAPPAVCSTLSACVASNIVTTNHTGTGCLSWSLTGTSSNGDCACNNAGNCLDQQNCSASATLSVTVQSGESWTTSPGFGCSFTNPAQAGAGVGPGHCNSSVSIEITIWQSGPPCQTPPPPGILCVYKLTSACGVGGGCAASTGC